MKKQCLVCGKEFTTYPCYKKLGRGKYCSQKCSSKSQITGESRKCLACGKKFHAFQSQIKRGNAKYCSRKCFNVSRIGKTKKCPICNKAFYSYRSDDKFGRRKYCSWQCCVKGKREGGHWNWRGDDVGYSGLHTWVKKKLGFPNRCEICGTEGGILDWANKDHKYKRNLDDWIRLCKKCHFRYDLENGYRLPPRLKKLPAVLVEKAI